MNKIPLTVAGEVRMREELNRLKNEERPRIIEAIAEARAHGDLKENAEYHAAKEQQGFIEGRIKDLEAKLSNCQVIDVSKLPQNGKVVFGVTVELEDIDSGDALEANKISVSSPIARAMIGKEAGDVAKVQTPGGVRELEIVEVRYL
jgi:transcription elongation factor GreA